jgi:acetoin utilization deacetylase AcuC-like enzyme/formylglycine-generating enzyme required for sulfatase activity
MRERSAKMTAGILSPFLIFFILFGMSCQKAGSSRATAKTPTAVRTKSGIEMVLIPGGWFRMGSKWGKADESPVHKVWIDSFLMDRYEVSQEQYVKLVGVNPSHFRGSKMPVDTITWADAALYCNLRSDAEGLQTCYNEETAKCNFRTNGYRLPTEAEWEYACRAGSDKAHFFGRDTRKLKDYAWFRENSFEKTHPVGQKIPNRWGLYDIYGNVAEWCNDVYDENYYKRSPSKNPPGPRQGDLQVLRGGAWDSGADSCRSSWRTGEKFGFVDACIAQNSIGFRCVKSAPHSILEGSEGPASSIQHQASSTAFIYSDIYLQHKTGANHPERPQRLEAIVTRLKEKGLGERGGSPLQLITPAPSPDSTEWITTIHTPQYLERVRKSCQESVEYLDSIDTPISPESYKVAVAAVGGVLSAIDAVMEGEVRNAFCAIRPPGHHALKDRAMGFCLFNNVAIGARYIQKKYELSKVLIVDWDVHHGNGTQAAFYDDPTVLYFSTHQYPFYPGSGSKEERGTGKGLGYNINVPLPAGCGDEEYKRAFEEILKPEAIEFDPDFVLISAGFDAHKDDPLGGMNVTASGFAEMTSIVKKIAETCCEGRIVSILEGGYDLDGLADSVEAHVSVLQK